MSTTIVAAIIGVFVVLERIGLLERLKLTRPTAAAALAELEVADRQISRLRVERDEAVDRANELAKTRSFEPILEQLAANAQLQAQVIDRLAAHNGSFAHMEQGLGEVVESLRTLTGLIAELHDIPLKGRDT